MCHYYCSSRALSLYLTTCADWLVAALTTAPTTVPSNAPSNAPTKVPTPAPTKAPTNSTQFYVSQVVTFSSLDSSSYSGTLKTNYEKGYGIAVGACTSPCSSYDTGVAIQSSITSRRAAAVTFVLIIISDGPVNAQEVEYIRGCSGSCNISTLESAISTAIGTPVTVLAFSNASFTLAAPTIAPTIAPTSAPTREDHTGAMPEPQSALQTVTPPCVQE